MKVKLSVRLLGVYEKVRKGEDELKSHGTYGRVYRGREIYSRVCRDKEPLR